ncbi:MAG TPA: DUF523 domain-containing protein [Chloroflexi bacterium]|nr:DUF523 domain-containing protein [Chloroflexota bacterium]
MGKDRPVYLVSACLVGLPTAYDGKDHLVRGLMTLAARGQVVPVCPEVAGGLPIPRPPAEIVGGSGEDVLDGQARVVTANGQDVTAAYLRGAEIALTTAQRYGAAMAVFKARSPACGTRWIYDGTHTGHLTAGQGVAAALLLRAGIWVTSGEEFVTGWIETER